MHVEETRPDRRVRNALMRIKRPVHSRVVFSSDKFLVVIGSLVVPCFKLRLLRTGVNLSARTSLRARRVLVVSIAYR